MSWIQKLYETYENCQSAIGEVVSDKEVPLLPICHTTNKAQVEVVINQQGIFQRARVVPKNDARTIIPCTETSGGRTSGEAPHPLSDKLQYVAKDYLEFGGSKNTYFEKYKELLEKWCASHFTHSKAQAILKYITKGRVIEDLISQSILINDDNGKLKKKPKKLNKDDPEIFTVLNEQSEAFVRWEVETPNDPCSKIWKDKTLWKSWGEYYINTKKEKTLCYISGKEMNVADIQPAKLRHDGDKAKLISSNDMSGFTFRGRFKDAKQACGVGFEITQKAHSALRWLISRQGYRNGDQAVVAWATSGEPVPDPLADKTSVLGEDELMSDEPGVVATAQNIALKFNRKMAGYKTLLGDTSGIVVMGLGSATQGRMAITYYRELTSSDLLRKIEQWQTTCSWIHAYHSIGEKKDKKRIYFIGAPAPYDIAQAAYGSKVDDKLRKTTVERLLPCIIDGQQIPRDIVVSAVRRACNRVGMENWEWNKTLSIACALYRQLNEKEEYSMALDENRKTRDYLYGRLLALADSLEHWALSEAHENRQTNAARFMQRFAERPFTTWKTIELSLAPYKARLGGKAQKRLGIMDVVHNMFETPEDYTSDKSLSGEFLLGYHCQRTAIRDSGKSDEPEQEQSNNEGDK